MLIAGLDLAAEPKGTAIATLEWSEGQAQLIDLQVGVADESIIELALSVEKLGIDCALGWPVEFVDFINAYSAGTIPSEGFDGGIDWRRKLAYRETDREVRRVTGRWPLSVSTDRLGMTAMRCAGILSKLQSAGVEIDKSGRGKVVEIYPAASMRIWGLQIAGYRNSESLREQLVGELQAEAPWLDLKGFEGLMITSCDCFDAVIAALAALSQYLGCSSEPPAEKLHQAQIEGWVALPVTSLASLGTRLG